MANNRPIYIGTHKTTDAERAEIEAYNASLDNQQSDVYVDYNAAEAGQQQNADYLMNAAVNPAQQQQLEPYWTPQQINRQYVADMANPNPAPDEIRPGNVSRDAIHAANEYYKIKYNNAPVTEWKADPLNDLYYQNVISKSWGDPNPEVEQSDPLGEIIPKVPDYGTGKYEDMWGTGKFWYSVLPSTSATSDAPSHTKYTRAIIPAVTSAGGGAALGSLAAAGLSALGLATPVGWAAATGAGLVGAASYVQSAFDVKIPVLNSVLEGIDVLATKTEQLWRTGELYIHKGEVENAGQFIWELAKFKIGLNSKLGGMDEYNARMAAASTMYETKTTGLGDTLMDLINRGYNLFAENDIPISKAGEAYMYNRGLMTPQQVTAPEGVEATDMLAGVVKEMVKITNPDTRENYTYREAQDVIQQWAYDTFGSTAFLNELVESSVFDPANLIPFISAYAVKNVGKVTGNAALVTAADLNIGNPLIDALPPVIQNFAEIAANKMGVRGSSKGIFSTLDTYKNVLRYGTKLENMSIGQMKQANLTPEGKFAEYQPTDITGRRGWLNKLISETPESKVMGLTALTSDMVTAVYSISPDYESFKQNIVALASDTAPDINSPIAGLWGTAAHKTILDNLKTIIDQGDYKILFDLYEQTAGNRAALADISNALGKQQKDVITLAQDKPEVLKQMINDYAVQHDGKLGNLIIDDGGTNAVDMLQMYTGKNPQAWNENILRFEVTTKIADSLSDMLIEQYGIKADNVAIRLSNLMKKAQSVVLLGFSPSYIANNLINNVVTRASVGAIGGVTLNQYRTFMENAGIFPARFAEDAGILRGDSIKSATPYGKAAENISDVKRKGDWIDKAGDTFGKTKKFSLGKLNSVIESTEGQRAYGAGIMQFFHRVWKPDNGFRRMDKALETMIEMQSPGLSNLIYSTISQYFDMASIERALYASMLTPDASEVLTNIGKRLFPNDPYVVSEIFDKSGITAEIQDKMRNAATRAERENAIRDIYNRAETYRDKAFANEMVNMAEAIGNIATAEGLPAVHEILTNMAILEMDHWINNRADFTNTYDTKVRFELARDDWRKLIGATVARQANDYKNFNAMRLQTYDGIIRGLGFSELEAKDFIRFMGEQDAVYRDFFAEKTKLLKEAYRKTEQIDSRRNIGKSEKDTQIEAIWDNFNYETQTLYKEAYQNERRLTINRNEIFVQAYEKATGADGSQLTTLFDQILSTRDEMHEKQIEMHQWTAEIKKQYKNDYTKRDQVIKERYDTEFNPYYNQKIQDIRDLNQKVIDESQKDGFVARAEYGYSQPKTSEPKILRDQIIEAIEVQNIGKAAENGRKTAQMISDGYLSRDKYRQEWIDKGVPGKAVDLHMAIADTLARNWERKNPGKNFYTEGLRIREITNEIGGGNGLFQTYAAAAADGSPWYSHMETVIADKFPEKMNAQSVRNWLIKQGVTKQEMQWSGMDGFLDSATGQVTKVDLQRVVDMERMKIEEVDISEKTKKISYDDWAYDIREKIDEYDNEIDSLMLEIDEEFSLDEIIDTNTGLLKETGDRDVDYLVVERNKLYNDYLNDIIPENVTKENVILEPIYDSYITDGNNNNYTEKIITLPEVDAQYQSNHWKGIDNPVFHVRFDDRIDSQGRKILFIEEFQSDWAQHLKDGETAPLADVWERKAIQRMMNYAADGGYDMVAWAPGSEHMNRYDLGAVADEITLQRGQNKPLLSAIKDGKNVHNVFVDESKLADYIGKQKAELILNSQEYQSTGKYTLTGGDLVVGDTWPLKFYDQDIANATRKIIKRYGSDLETTLIDTGNGNMLEVQAYKVTAGMAEPQKLFQAFQDGVKGKFEVIDGDVAIRIFQSGDVSTMVHESGHAFRRTLDDAQMEDFAKWNGFESAEAYRELDYRYWNDKKSLTPEESKRYVDAEEKFARGWEQYLTDGIAPTNALKAIFQQFTSFLLDIYRSVKEFLTKDYKDQSEFSFDGKTLDINETINNVKLRDIFDSMLVDSEKSGTYAGMLDDYSLSLELGNAAYGRMDPETLRQHAMLGLNQEILKPFASLEHAEIYLKKMDKPYYTFEGEYLIDQDALSKAIINAKFNKEADPFKGENYSKEFVITNYNKTFDYLSNYEDMVIEREMYYSGESYILSDYYNERNLYKYDKDYDRLKNYWLSHKENDSEGFNYKARLSVNTDILSHYGSLEEAEYVAANGYGMHSLINGHAYRDIELYDAVLSAKSDNTLNPFKMFGKTFNTPEFMYMGLVSLGADGPYRLLSRWVDGIRVDKIKDINKPDSYIVPVGWINGYPDNFTFPAAPEGGKYITLYDNNYIYSKEHGEFNKVYLELDSEEAAINYVKSDIAKKRLHGQTGEGFISIEEINNLFPRDEINYFEAKESYDPFVVDENTAFNTIPDGDYQFEQTAFDDGKPIRIEYAEKLIKAGYDPDRLQTLKENLYEAVSHDLDDNAKEIAIKSVDSIINSGLLTTETIPMETLAATEVWKNTELSQDMKMFIIENINAARISIYEIQKEILAGENIRDGNIPPEGIYMRRSQTSQIGNHEIVADVFNDGQFVAYYPYGFNTELVTLSDGTQVRPLGISGDNPDVYVYIDSMDGIHEVNVDKPHGYENAYVQSEGETLVNRGTPVGATPMIEPDGSANSEILNKYIYPVLDEFIAEYEKAYNDGASKNLKQVDQDTRVRILKYLDDVVKPDMASAKFNAMKFGEFKRDAALLNYSKTYGFDSYLTMISPYQFWYTRSMLNWAKRLIDKPAYLTAAMRYRALAEKNKKEEYPYRLNNLFRIPLAGLPDWMGGGTFVDILSQTSPFLQFLSPVENMLSEQNTLNKKAYSILDELIEANEITGAQKIEAIRTKDNDLWRTVIAQAKLEYGKDPSVKNLFDQYLSPPLWLSWAKNIYQGKGSEIGMLPITRFGNTVGTLADDTFLEGFGQIAKSALTAPEKGLRKIAGLDYKEFGEFENYNIWKQIMQMIVDGDIEVNQGLNAMVEMKGDIYNEAVKRQREENAIKTQGALPIYEMKRLLQGEEDASIGGVMASLILTPLGSKVFPSGEKGAREMQAKLDQAYIDKDNGDKDAVSRFWRENPEYYARLASFKDSPEEMMRYVLHTFSKNFYYSQPKAQQQAILNNYGPEFYQTIIDPSTSNWREADIDKMAFWAQGLTGNIPDVERFANIRKQQQTLQFYAPQVVSDYDLFLAEQDRLFPGQSAKKKAYYALDKTQKSAYRKTDPLFDQYLTWEWEYKKANPNVKTVIDDRNNYYDEVMAYDSFGDMPESVVSDFDYWAVTGKPMRGTTMRMLHNLYDKYADPNYNTFEQYLEILKRYR